MNVSMASYLLMDVVSGYLAICLSAHMAKTDKEIRDTVKRVIKRVPKHERYKFKSFLVAYNTREAVQKTLTALVHNKDI